MTEATGNDGTPFPQTVGERLRVARETEGVALSEIAARTRIPQRHLEAIETGNYAGLPSPTYAVGFVRAYARAIGLDEVPLARDARIEVAQQGRPTPQYQAYEITDPARTPSRTTVIVAAGLGLAVLVLGLLWFASGMAGRSSTGVGDTAQTPAVAVGVPAAAPSVAPTPQIGGQVALTATDEVWLRVTDAGGAVLFQGTMKPGDRFDVPASANAPRLNVGRPDKLQVSLNGASVPPLGDGRRPLSGVAIGPEAIRARLNAAATAGTPAASPTPIPAPSPSASAGVPRAFAPTTSAAPRPRSSPSRAARPAPKANGPENLLPKGFGDDGN